MRRGAIRVVTAAALGLVGASACGKRGDPLPPLRPVPARIVDLTASRIDDQVELRFTVPSLNADGSSPAAIDRVLIFAAPATPAVPVPAANLFTSDAANQRNEVPLRRLSDESAPPAPDQAARPAPGERASVVDRITVNLTPGATAMHYVAVGVTGPGRGRRGPLSNVVVVPLGPGPAPPSELTVTNDETSVRVRWTPSGPRQAFQVFATARVFEPATARPLLPAPAPASEFSAPVTFGVEQCFAVRAVEVSGGVTVEGSLSAVRCATPEDIYPPAPPSGLQAVQEGDGVTLNWSAVDASDLAGYIVLRTESTGENMQPLMRDPIAGTSYRDASVRPGMTYTYTVYAVDRAVRPNISQQSNRQTVSVR